MNVSCLCHRLQLTVGCSWYYRHCQSYHIHESTSVTLIFLNDATEITDVTHVTQGCLAPYRRTVLYRGARQWSPIVTHHVAGFWHFVATYRSSSWPRGCGLTWPGPRPIVAPDCEPLWRQPVARTSAKVWSNIASYYGRIPSSGCDPPWRQIVTFGGVRLWSSVASDCCLSVTSQQVFVLAEGVFPPVCGGRGHPGRATLPLAGQAAREGQVAALAAIGGMTSTAGLCMCRTGKKKVSRTLRRAGMNFTLAVTLH